MYLRGNLRVRLATQRKFLRKFNLRPLAATCRSVWPGLYCLAESISYVGGVAFGKGIGPVKTPLSTSSRFVSCVYSCLALIMINSYCANIMAFLVEERVSHLITGVHDPKVSVQEYMKGNVPSNLGTLPNSWKQTWYRDSQAFCWCLNWPIRVQLQSWSKVLGQSTSANIIMVFLFIFSPQLEHNVDADSSKVDPLFQIGFGEWKSNNHSALENDASDDGNGPTSQKNY